MRLRSLTVLPVLILALAVLMPRLAGAATIVCASEEGGHRYCGADTRGGVYLARQLSRSACVDGESWDYDANGIWVDRGCRAEFTLGHVRGTRDGRRLVCASDGHDYRHCRANTRQGVRLFRQLSRSRCAEGEDWGHDEDGVWVNNGCRAEFALGGGFAAGTRAQTGDDDDLGNSALLGVGALAGLAVLAGALGGNGDGAPAAQPAGSSLQSGWLDPDRHYASSAQPPAWLVGRFHGYNPLYDAGMLIEITTEGAATAYVQNIKLRGRYREGRLSLGGVDYTVMRETEGLRTIQDNDPANQVVYARAP